MKKLLSVLMVLCMMLTLLPAVTVAAEGDIIGAEPGETPGEDMPVDEPVPTEPETPLPPLLEGTVSQSLGSGTIYVDSASGMLMEVRDVTGVTVIPTEVGGITITSIYSSWTEAEDESTIDAISAFSASPELTSVVLPGTIKEIGQYAFYSNAKLSEVTLSEGVTAIGRKAFANSVLEKINIPRTVTSIDPQFCDSERLTVNLDAANGAYMIENGIIYSKDIRTVICAPEQTTINKNLTFNSRTRTIASRAFMGRKNLVTVEFSDGVRVLEDAVFKNCVDLNLVTMNRGVTRVGNEIFSGCTNLIKVNIPDTITTYGDYMFKGCEKLNSLVIPKAWRTVSEGMYMNSGLASVPNAQEITSIGAYAFAGSTMLRSVDFTDSLTTIISAHAFEGCTGLNSVTLKAGMKVGSFAFAGSGVSGTLNIPERLVLDGGYQFANCVQLEKVSIGRNNISLGELMFAACENLKEAMIPETVVNLNNAFENVSPLLVITGYSGSDAHRYAVSKIIPFISIGFAEVKLTDIAEHWGKTDIEWTYYQALFGGTSPTTFEPNLAMTRAMFVAVMQRLAQEKAVGEADYFIDVEPFWYYTPAVSWAVEAGITDGTSPTEFSPNLNIRRQDLCTMLYRYAIHKGYDYDVYDQMMDDQEAGLPIGINKFGDAGIVANYAKEALNWAIYKGIINGDEFGMINPNGPATRAEVAAMIHRFCTAYGI